MHSIMHLASRIGKTLGLMLLVFILVVPINAVAMSEAQRQIFDFGIPYYNTDDDTPATGPCGGRTPSVLNGNTNQEKVWNYFVNANIPGVSDNAAVIAGIMGNIKAESTFNPFNKTGSYYGLWQTLLEGTFRDNMTAAGLDQYWGSSNAPQEAQDKAIIIQLDYLLSVERWGGTGSGWPGSISFMNNLDSVDDKNSPRSYAELFLVSVEGAYPGGSYGLSDSKVRAIATSHGWGDNKWQMKGDGDRRDNAETFFNDPNFTSAGASGGSASDVCLPTGVTISGDLAFPLAVTQSQVDRPIPSTHNYKANDIYKASGDSYRADSVEGVEVVAYKGGTVLSAKDSSPAAGKPGGPRSNISIQSDDIITTYIHLQPGAANRRVASGDPVDAGQLLGFVGNSAAADDTPPHLHIDAVDAAGGSRPGCSRVSCPPASQARFIDLTPSLQALYDKLPGG